jgi:hypothetical protein
MNISTQTITGAQIADIFYRIDRLRAMVASIEGPLSQEVHAQLGRCGRILGVTPPLSDPLDILFMGLNSIDDLPDCIQSIYEMGS